MHVGQAALDAVVIESQPRVVDAQQVQDRGVEIVDVNGLLGHSTRSGCSDHHFALGSASSTAVEVCVWNATISTTINVSQSLIVLCLLFIGELPNQPQAASPGLCHPDRPLRIARHFLRT